MDQARIDGKPFATNQTSRNARLDDSFEQPAENIAFTKALVPSTRERRMIRHSILDTELAEPAIGEVHLHFTTDQSFRADHKDIIYDQHPDHQFRIEDEFNDEFMEAHDRLNSAFVFRSVVIEETFLRDVPPDWLGDSLIDEWFKVRGVRLQLDQAANILWPRGRHHANKAHGETVAKVKKITPEIIAYRRPGRGLFEVC